MAVLVEALAEAFQRAMPPARVATAVAAMAPAALRLAEPLVLAASPEERAAVARRRLRLWGGSKLARAEAVGSTTRPAAQHRPLAQAATVA